MKHVFSLLLAVLAVCAFSPAMAQGFLTPRSPEVAESAIREQERKIAYYVRQIELHEQCLRCDTCACSITNKNGQVLHKHVAKKRQDKKNYVVRHTGSMDSCDPLSMAAKVEAEIDKLVEQIRGCEERIIQLKRTLKAMGRTYSPREKK